MARKTFGSDVSEAFDMFLDTISNAFGGIVFISLLVCVMLQLTQSISKQPDPGEMERLRNTLKIVQAEIDSFLKVKEEQIRQIKLLGSIVDPELLKKYLELVQKEKDLQVAYSDLIAAINAMRLGTDDLRRKLLDLEAQRNELIDKLDKLKKKGVPEEGAPPVAKLSRKKSVAVFISQGRMSFCSKYNDKGEPVAANDDDVLITKNEKGTFLSPKPGRGMAVDGSPDGLKKIAEAFGAFSANPKPGQDEKDAHCVVMVVWPDSYSQCAVVRDWLIGRKFEYGLIFMREGQQVQMIRGAGATPTFGQR
jgi:hypothetical protein